MANGITAETVKEMSEEDKLNVLVDLAYDSNERLCRLENRKIWNTTTNICSGVVGGFVGFLTMVKLKIFQ